RHPAPDVLVPGVLADPGPHVLPRGVPGVALPAVVPRLPGRSLVPDLPVRALPPGVAPRLGGPEPGRRPVPSRTGDGHGATRSARWGHILIGADTQEATHPARPRRGESLTPGAFVD